jgi:CRISPR-associated protein Csb2
MIAIGIRFLAGRYHATGWDHQVNEGTVEWPPSPWRLLRALVAASYKVLPELPQRRVEAALGPLRSPPLYAVPPATTGHTRHYIPDGKHRRGITGDTDLVIDAFVVPEPGAELIVTWPKASGVDLEALDAILEQLQYLGRAESWVEARRLAAAPASSNTRPAVPGEAVRGSRVRLMALDDEPSFKAWRGQLEASRIASKNQGTKTKKKGSLADVLPETWWDILHADTTTLAKGGWSGPPGVRWVEYVLEAPPVSRAPRRLRTAPARVVNLARFEITSAVHPPLGRALPVGERIRLALMSIARDRPEALALWSGKDAGGARQPGHRHAFFLPTDDDCDGKIDHILVWARDAFPAEARECLGALRRLWGDDGHDLLVALVGEGVADELGTTRAQYRAGCGLTTVAGAARTWRSVTPFVAPRHPRRRHGQWLDTPEQQVQMLLESMGLPPATSARLDRRWSRFVQVRHRGGGARSPHPGLGFELRFAEPVTGPIALGYGAHMGLGQFEAIA